MRNMKKSFKVVGRLFRLHMNLVRIVIVWLNLSYFGLSNRKLAWTRIKRNNVSFKALHEMYANYFKMISYWRRSSLMDQFKAGSANGNYIQWPSFLIIVNTMHWACLLYTVHWIWPTENKHRININKNTIFYLYIANMCNVHR